MNFKALLLYACLAGPATAQISAHSYAVIDDRGNVLLEKNSNDIRPIASITKLFSLSHVTPTDKILTITDEEVDTLKGTRMRLKKGSYNELELISVALSSSNNEAAKTIGRAHQDSFILAQQRFPDIHLVEPSGLDPENRSSALALSKAALEVAKLPIAIETLKVAPTVGAMKFRNTNPLLQARGWDFKVAKTGFINEAGACLVAVIEIGGRNYSFAILGSKNTKERWRDLSRLRQLISDEPFAVYANTKTRLKKKRK